MFYVIALACENLWSKPLGAKNLYVISKLNFMRDENENYGEGYITYTPSERLRAYLGGTLGYLFDGYNLLLTTFLLTAIATTFKTGISQVALAITFALVGSVVGGIFYGWLGDKVGRRTTLLLTILDFSIFEILSGFSTSLSFFTFSNS
jgi:hypothetical protein